MTPSLLINIDVPDIDRAVAFYTTALPLKVGRVFDSEFIELIGLPSPIYLLKKNSGTIPFPDGKTGRSYERHWCPVHMDFVVADIEETRLKLLAAGAVEESPVRSVPYGKISMYRDPFGHGLCLIQFTGRGYDALINP